MPNIKMIKAILSEYGIGWAVNRSLYSVKLKMMGIYPLSEKWFERKTGYPKRLDLFQIDVDYLQTFLRNELSEEDKVELISIADKACEGIITGFSSIELNYGNPIDWQFSPLTGIRCDEKKKWYKIPDFDKDRGDIKVIWEASRFSHFITLSRAYLLTGDDKYYFAFRNQLKDWLEKNSYSYGANFKCSQECSLRMVNALLAFTVFKNAGIATDVDASCVKDLIDRCYRKVLSNFFYAYKCIKNNHTISELMGMIVGAWCSEDPKRLANAYNLLDEVIDEQFTADGGYRQFSFNYQRLALQDLEAVLSLSDKTGIWLKQSSKDKIKNSGMLMYQCQDESGDVPNYGNNDGALVFPVTSCGYRNFNPVINTIHALVTGKQLYEKGIHQEELIWFSGGKSLQEYELEKKERKSSQFVDAGLFTIRGRNSWVMIVSNNFSSRPAHMDQMHFDLWANGVNVLCDAGTYSYASEEGAKLIRNENHNTVVVDGKTQMNASGPFMIYNWTKREFAICDDVSFSSKMISANGYEHVREIKLTGNTYTITDKVNNNHKIMFHTPCSIELLDEVAVLSKGGRMICTIKSNGKMTLQETKRSLYYLKKEKTNCLMISGKADTELKTIIIEGDIDK